MRLILALALLFAVHVASDAPDVYASLDAPQFGAVFTQGSLTLAGWAVNCGTGTLPSGLGITLTNGTDTIDESGYALATGYYRPDVAVAFATLCPSVTPTSAGYLIYLPYQPPPGEWTIWIAWSEADIASRDGRVALQATTITVVAP